MKGVFKKLVCYNVGMELVKKELKKLSKNQLIKIILLQDKQIKLQQEQILMQQGQIQDLEERIARLEKKQ